MENKEKLFFQRLLLLVSNLSLIFFYIVTSNQTSIAQIKSSNSYVIATNQSAPSNPAAGSTVLYTDTSNILHTLSSGGTDKSLLCTTCSGASLTGLGGDLSGTNLGTATVSTVGGASSTNIADAVTKKHSQNTDTGTTQTTYTINSGGSQLILTSSGQTGNHTVTFPNSTGTLLYNNGDGSNLTGIPTLSTNTFTGNQTFNAHIIGASSTPSGAVGASAQVGTGSGGQAPSITITGTDLAGKIDFKTGTTGSLSAGDLFTITFATAYGVAPYVVLTPRSTGAATLNTCYISAASTTTFTWTTNAAASNNTHYIYNYVVIQ